MVENIIELKNLCKSYDEDVKVTELFNEYSILLELIIKKNNEIPIEYNLNSMDEAIWEIKPAHLNHSLNINNESLDKYATSTIKDLIEQRKNL